MTQASIDFDTPQTFTARVVALLESRPGVWIPAQEFMKVGGMMGWRTRLSNARKAPYCLTVENRVRAVKGPDGKTAYKVSEYRIVSPSADRSV